jgi:hypothetical protein
MSQSENREMPDGQPEEREEDVFYGDESPEMSPDGTPIYRHVARDRVFQPAIGDEELINAVSEHLEKYVAASDTIYHEIISDLVHIDVHIVPATEDRPYHLLMTSGMAELPMKAPSPEFQWAELCILLPPSWPLAQEKWQDETYYWPVMWLKQLARLPHEYDTWVGFGHTIPNGDPAEPFAPGTDLCGWILLPSISLPEEFSEIKIAPDKTINVWSIVPLHEDEMILKLRKGTEALLELFSAKGVTDVIDAHRPSVCEPRKRGWFFRR